MMGFGRQEVSETPAEERAAILEQHAQTSEDPEAVASRKAFADAGGHRSPLRSGDEMKSDAFSDGEEKQSPVDDESNSAPNPLVRSGGRAGDNPANPHPARTQGFRNLLLEVACNQQAPQQLAIQAPEQPPQQTLQQATQQTSPLEQAAQQPPQQALEQAALQALQQAAQTAPQQTAPQQALQQPPQQAYDHEFWSEAHAAAGIPEYDEGTLVC